MAKQQSARSGPAKAGKRKVYLSPQDPRATGNPENPSYGSRRLRVARSMATWQARREAARKLAVASTYESSRNRVPSVETAQTGAGVAR